MPSPSRSTLTMPMSAQSSLSHCTTTRPGMAGGLERDHRVEAALADHHAARMLAEMARQVLHLLPEPGKQLHALGLHIQADRGQMPRQRSRSGSENSKWFMTFASRSTCAGSKPSTLPTSRAALLPRYVMTLAVMAAPCWPYLLVDVLDDALAPIAARQIEVDVRPLAAFLGQEAFEQQIHAHRIHGRDPQAVTHGAVGGRPAALHENVVLAAEVHDVPDDEKVAGEIEPFDEIQLARDLRARAVVIRPVAIAGADVGEVS